MSLNNFETYKDEADPAGGYDGGQTRWRVTTGNEQGTGERNIVAVSPDGYTNERDALSAFFTMFFGTWDESFLEKYDQWQSYAGEAEKFAESLPPEAKPGPNVLVQNQEQRDAIEAHRTGEHDERGKLIEGDDVTRGGTLGGEE